MSSTATAIGSPTRKRQKTSVATQTEEITTGVASAVGGPAIDQVLDILIDQKWDLPWMRLRQVNKEIRDQVEAAINSGNMSFSTFSKGQLTVLNDKTKQAFKYAPPQAGEALRHLPPYIYFETWFDIEEYIHNDTSDCIENFRRNVAAPYKILLDLKNLTKDDSAEQQEIFIINYLNDRYSLMGKTKKCIPRYTVFFAQQVELFPKLSKSMLTEVRDLVDEGDKPGHPSELTSALYAFVSNGGVEMILKMFDYSDRGMNQSDLSYLLYQLSTWPDLSYYMVCAGVIDKAKTILSNYNKSEEDTNAADMKTCAQNMSWMLSYLIVNGTDVKSICEKEGIIEIAKMGISKGKGNKEALSDIVRELSNDESCQKKILQAGIVDLAIHEIPLDKEIAVSMAGMLLKLSKNSAMHEPLIRKGVMDLITSTISENKETAKEMAGVLVELSKNSAMHEPLIKTGIMGLIMSTISENKETATEMAGVLVELSKNSAMHEHLISKEIMDLIRSTISEDKVIATEMAGILVELSENTNTHKPLIESMIDVAKTVIQNRSKNDDKMIAMLVALSKNKANHEPLKETGVIPLIEKAIKSRDPLVLILKQLDPTNPNIASPSTHTTAS